MEKQDGRSKKFDRIDILHERREKLQSALVEIQVAEDYGCNMGQAGLCLKMALEAVNDELEYIT